MSTEILNGIYVVHYDPTIEFAGTKKEAEKVCAEKKARFPALDWQVSTIEHYGNKCHRDGREDGYNEGYDWGSN